MIVACATDDGTHFVSRHFGDADYYYIYRVEKDSISFIDTIDNTTEEEEQHADPKKAKGIVSLLKEMHVSVAVTTVFGPNIKRIAKHLLPVLANQDSIEASLKQIQENYDRITQLLVRDNLVFLNLKTNQETAITAQ
jgi:predicted Fe-Mo cluster-binding NifX family protein